MLSVYKYPVIPNDYIDLSLPQGAIILSVQSQYDKPQLWALVDPESPVELRRFRLAGTGHPIKESADKLYFHDTFQLHGGQLIFHLFEVVK
jgi:hypothetical protein